MKCFGVFVAAPSIVGSATIRKVLSAVKSPARILLNPDCTHGNPTKYQPVAVDEPKEEKKGEEFQGKEGMSWIELSTGWRAPR
jgi:hypothetical protein